MIVKVPTPEVAGLNVPLVVFVIPVPLQVPPAGLAEKLNADALAHTGATGVIDAVPAEVTTCCSVSLFVQLFASVYVYVIVNVPVPAVVGLNVPLAALVIPVPLQVPPLGVAVRLKDAAPTQTGVVGLIVTVGSGLTVTITGTLYVPGHDPT